MNRDMLPMQAADTAGAALRRGLPAESFARGQLVAIAQKLLGLVQESPDSSPYESSLSSAGRILDAIGEVVAPDDVTASERLAALSSVAFACGGNWPSAHAVAHRLIPSLAHTGASAVAIGTAIPSMLGQVLIHAQQDDEYGRYLRLLNAYLERSDTEQEEQLPLYFEHCLARCDDIFEGALLRSARAIVPQLVRMSTSRVLSKYDALLPQGMIQTLVGSGVKTLLPSQYSALCDGSLLDQQSNCLIAYPTSTGKTLLGELCMARGLSRQPGVVAYVAPYVAIGRQAARALEKHLPQSCRIHRLFGAFETTDTAFGENTQDFLVCTPERFDGLLRGSSSLIDSLKVVVFDEVHLIENASRGVRLEAILSRLRMLQQQHSSLQLVLLSAVVSNAASIRDWMGIEPHRVFESEWRPSVGRIAVWTQDGTLDWKASTQSFGSSSPTEQGLGRANIPWPNRGIPPSNRFDVRRVQEPRLAENVAYLCDALFHRLRGPVLVVSATKRATRQIARAVGARFEPLSPLPRFATELVELITRHYPAHNSLAALIKRGVAYHNASVPHDVRALIEDAVLANELRVVTATTTLAEGVDLPFRTTILADWLVWTAGGQQPMSRLLFKNIVGRSGRAGRFAEGDTVLMDNPIGDISFTDPVSRQVLQNGLISAPPELTSAIRSTLAAPGMRQELLGTLSSQFLAAIPENPLDSDLANTFANSLLASRFVQTSAIRDLVLEVKDELMDPARGALAIAASPLQLTPLGRAVKLTGLSAHTARRLIALLRATKVLASVPHAAATLMQEFADVPEQTNQDLAKVVSSSSAKFCVKPDDFNNVVAQYLSGSSALDMFVALPFVQRSRRSPPLSAWLEGVPAPEWEDLYDKFVAFLQDVIQGFLPWMFRACAALSAHSDVPTQTIDWSAAARALDAPMSTDDID